MPYLRPGTIGKRLYPVQGNNRFCGPCALSAVTGRVKIFYGANATIRAFPLSGSHITRFSMCALSFPNRISTGIGKIQATPTLRGANERSRTATHSPNPLLPLDLHYSIRNVHPTGLHTKHFPNRGRMLWPQVLQALADHGVACEDSQQYAGSLIQLSLFGTHRLIECAYCVNYRQQTRFKADYRAGTGWACQHGVWILGCWDILKDRHDEGHAIAIEVTGGPRKFRRRLMDNKYRTPTAFSTVAKTNRFGTLLVQHAARITPIGTRA